jgi:LysM repeat protein
LFVACYEQSFGQHVFDRSKQPIHRRSHEGAIMAMAVVIPGRFGEHRSAAQLYARRRLMVTLIVAAIVLVLFVGAGHVVANRGGAPASTSAIRPVSAAAPAAPVAANVYIVQPGDTLWSIGQRFHGHTSLADYVDALVSANGGTGLQVSQALALP